MYTLIAHPRFVNLISEMAQENPEKYTLGNIEYAHFPDRTPNLRFPEVKEKIEHKHIAYIGDFSEMSDCFDQYNLLFNIVKNSASSLTIFMPFFPVGTSERVERKGLTESAHAFAHLFSSLPSGLDRKNILHIFNIHALVEQSLFDIEKIHVELHTTTGLIEIQSGENIVFPDDGASKRFRYAFEDIPESDRIICSKVRNESGKIITIKEGNPNGKNVIIIDDLIQSGGTIRETVKILRKNGAEKIRVFVPHGVFPREEHENLVGEVDELIITDSIPKNNERAKNIANMTIVSLCPLIDKILL